MIENNQGIIIILVIILLTVCYFAPISHNLEEFSNEKGFNPKTYKKTQFEVPGPAVESWKINQNMFEPGPYNSLNYVDVQTMFPWTKIEQKTYDGNDIKLVKSDGVIVGGYVPQIIRPSDSVSKNPSKDSDCQWPCYSDKKHQKWCSEENAINYYAMRPIINSNKYDDLIKQLFKGIIDKGTKQNFVLDQQKLTSVFCTETKEALMSWLMQKIALQVSKMPAMQKNSSWHSERFYETDVEMYQYINENNDVFFKIIFNLYNPLRSISTITVATIFILDGKPLLNNITTVTEGRMGDFIPPTPSSGGISGYNINNGFESGSRTDIIMPENLGYQEGPQGQKEYDENYRKNPNELDWEYKNTLLKQEFNKDGFYSNVPGSNVKIVGGIPDSLRNKIKADPSSQENLSKCMDVKYTGISNGQPTDTSGCPKLVNANPSVTYNITEPMSLRSVETIDKVIYI